MEDSQVAWLFTGPLGLSLAALEGGTQIAVQMAPAASRRSKPPSGGKLG